MCNNIPSVYAFYFLFWIDVSLMCFVCCGFPGLTSGLTSFLGLIEALFGTRWNIPKFQTSAAQSSILLGQAVGSYTQQCRLDFNTHIKWLTQM